MAQRRSILARAAGSGRLRTIRAFVRFASTAILYLLIAAPACSAADEVIDNPQFKAAAPPAAPAAAAPAPGAPLPTSSCKDCHEEQIAALARTAHRGASPASGFTPHETDLQAVCVTCHGPIPPHGQAAPGSVPAITIPPYAKRSAEERSAPCLVCHNGPTTLHWAGSTHATQDVACTDCHRMHPQGSPVRGLPAKGDEVPTCLSCHRTVSGSLWQSSHHPVREGRMFCTGCHEPHGTMNAGQLKRPTVNETCYLCHAEKRGPFLWIHPPAMENCLNCHTAHASLHDALLINKPPRLCQTCHLAPQHVSEPHDYRSHDRPQLYVFNKGCDNCHQVHGSNSPSGPTLLR